MGAPRSKPAPRKLAPPKSPHHGGVRGPLLPKLQEKKLFAFLKRFDPLLQEHWDEEERAAHVTTVRDATPEDEAWLAANGVTVVRKSNRDTRTLQDDELKALRQIAKTAVDAGNYKDTHQGTRLFYNLDMDERWQDEPLLSAPWFEMARRSLGTHNVDYMNEAGRELILRREGCPAQEAHRDVDDPLESAVVVGIPLHSTSLSCTGTAFYVDTTADNGPAWVVPKLEPGEWVMWSGSALHRGWSVRPSGEWPPAGSSPVIRDGFLPLIVLKLSVSPPGVAGPSS